MKEKIKFNIGDWKHYNSFDEDCGCDSCGKLTKLYEKFIEYIVPPLTMDCDSK